MSTAPAGESVLYGLFSRHVATAGAHDAVRDDSGSLTYAELSRRVAVLATAVREHCPEPGTRIGLHLGRDAGLVVAVLAVTAAGHTYVPLDPAYPEERLRFMADDSGLSVVLTDRELPSGLSGALALRVDLLDLSREVPELPGADTDPETPAYVIYTSGSTGRPKGVEVRRRSVAAMVEAVCARHATAGLLTSWNLRPAAVVGHSLGAYAAACLTGVFFLPDAVRLMAERGRLLGAVPAGGMAAVRLAESQATPRLPAGLSVGAVNGPGQCTVTGPADLVARFAGELAGEGVEARMLRIATAGHSALVEPVLDRFADVVAGLHRAEPVLPFLSDTTGRWADSADLRSVDYWVRHLRQPVRFGAALSTLFGMEREHALVDIGPGRALSTLARQHPGHDGTRTTVHASPHPTEPASDAATVLTAAGELWAAGAPVDFGALHSGETRHRVPLPTYPFERRRYLVPPPERVRHADGAGVPASWIGAGQEAAAKGNSRGAEPGDGQPPSTVLAAILEAFVQALGTPDIEPDDSFFDLGGDSLIATKLASWAASRFGVRVTAADILKSLDAATLATVVEERLEIHDPLPEANGR